MAYIKTVTILNNLTSTYVEGNVGTVYEAIHTKIASVTGWTKDDITPQIYIGTGAKRLRLNISYLAGSKYFAYEIHSDNSNGNVYIEENLINTVMSATYNTLYLHYMISKSGKTIGIGLSTYKNPIIDFIVAEDANGDFAGIGLNSLVSGNYYGAQMVWNGYKCILSNTISPYFSNNKNALVPIINASLSTTVCKLPNYLSGCTFKETSMILSLPISMSQLNGVVLDIGGKKYQGCYSYRQAITNESEYKNCLAILAE